MEEKTSQDESQLRHEAERIASTLGTNKPNDLAYIQEACRRARTTESENWLFDAVEAVKYATTPIRSPFAYFKTCLENSATSKPKRSRKSGKPMAVVVSKRKAPERKRHDPLAYAAFHISAVEGELAEKLYGHHLRRSK